MLCSIRLPSCMWLTFPGTVGICLPRAFSHIRASGASHVLRHLSSCMPRPEDSSGSSHPRLNGYSCIALGVRSNPRRPPLTISKLYQHFRGHGSPCGLQDTLSTLRPSCSPCLHGSAMDARLDTGGWLALTRQGLSPCKRCQAYLGVITLRLSRAWKRARSGRCKASAAAGCSAMPLRYMSCRWCAVDGIWG